MIGKSTRSRRERALVATGSLVVELVVAVLMWTKTGLDNPTPRRDPPGAPAAPADRDAPRVAVSTAVAEQADGTVVGVDVALRDLWDGSRVESLAIRAIFTAGSVEEKELLFTSDDKGRIQVQENDLRRRGVGAEGRICF